MRHSSLPQKASGFPARAIRAASLLILIAVVAGCASQPSRDSDEMDFRDFQNQYETDSEIDGVNEQLLSMAVSTNTSDSVYRLGPGDQIGMRVLGVDELSGSYRIDGTGRASLPLIGEVELSGYTVAEAEKALVNIYGENYLRNPVINLRVEDYRSQQFTAVGAVAQPRVYNTERRVTLIEALAMAGGLSGSAGSMVFVTDRVRNPETGSMGTRSVAIAIEDLTGNTAGDSNIVLGESAVVNVPAAGSIFVEGAVQNPGVFTRRGDTTVLKAITMAGGLKFEANRSHLRVLRRNPNTNEWSQQVVEFSEIRESPTADVALGDGDIVMVERGPIRSAWVGAWEGLSRLIFLGFRPL